VNAWLWFVIAAVAGVAGASLLMLDRGQRTSHSRERRRWAALRGWQFADSDPALPDRWRHGTLGRGGPGVARDLVTGSLFTAAGRRLVHVFDHDLGMAARPVLAAVHRRVPQATVLELWLPTVEFPAEAGLDLLGPVGDRYAFTSDLVKARPLITPELVALADDVGDDVPVMWIEDAWVVAAVTPGTAPSRLERLLRLLGDLADLVDGVHEDPAATDAAPGKDADATSDPELDELDELDEEPLDADVVDEELEPDTTPSRPRIAPAQRSPYARPGPAADPGSDPEPGSATPRVRPAGAGPRLGAGSTSRADADSEPDTETMTPRIPRSDSSRAQTPRAGEQRSDGPRVIRRGAGESADKPRDDRDEPSPA
jgi:hypothetical protein